MKIKVLFDKEKDSDQHHVGWGLSFLVGDTLLFDAGEKFEYLTANAEHMGVDLHAIEAVFITHEHWDHTGGLWGLLTRKPGLTVYGCERFSHDFREKIEARQGIFKPLKTFTQIADGVYSSGQSMVNYKGKPLYEQAMVIESGQELAVLCGCAHPGIVNIIEKVKATLGKSVALTAGGLHLMEKEQRFREYIIDQLTKLTRKVAPSHCTGYEAISLLRKEYGENFIEMKAGTVIEV